MASSRCDARKRGSEGLRPHLLRLGRVENLGGVGEVILRHAAIANACACVRLSSNSALKPIGRCVRWTM